MGGYARLREILVEPRHDSAERRRAAGESAQRIESGVRRRQADSVAVAGDSPTAGARGVCRPARPALAGEATREGPEDRILVLRYLYETRANGGIDREQWRRLNRELWERLREICPTKPL